MYASFLLNKQLSLQRAKRRREAAAWCCRELQNCSVDTEICLSFLPPEQPPKQCNSLHFYLKWAWPVTFSSIPRPRACSLGMGTIQRLLKMGNVPEMTKVEPFQQLSGCVWVAKLACLCGFLHLLLTDRWTQLTRRSDRSTNQHRKKQCD